jgi:hypothetical protein
MQGRDSVTENRYNDSIHILNFLSSLCVEISQNLTDCIVM